MNKKTILIVLLVFILISVIGFSTFLSRENVKYDKKSSPISPEAPEITISGRVLGTSFSLRAIHILKDDDLKEEVFTIALNDETQMISANGSKISLQDIQPEMHIKAVGKPAGEYGILAKQIQVLPY